MLLLRQRSRFLQESAFRAAATAAPVAAMRPAAVTAIVAVGKRKMRQAVWKP
jgi:hypothetical protein